MRSLFSMSSGGHGAVNVKANTEETEWEKVLEEAEKRASWQSSINYRPRQHGKVVGKGERTASYQMSWPRAGAGPAAREGVGCCWSMCLSMRVRRGCCMGGRGARRVLWGWSLPVSVAGSRHASVASAQRLSHVAVGEDDGQGRFGTLPRVNTMLLRREAAASYSTVQGTALLGRATLRRRQIPDAASIWQLGRRRSSGLAHSNSFSGSTRTMPAIPQGHSRETSLVDDLTEDPP